MDLDTGLFGVEVESLLRSSPSLGAAKVMEELRRIGEGGATEAALPLSILLRVAISDELVLDKTLLLEGLLAVEAGSTASEFNAAVLSTLDASMLLLVDSAVFSFPSPTVSSGFPVTAAIAAGRTAILLSSDFRILASSSAVTNLADDRSTLLISSTNGNTPINAIYYMLAIIIDILNCTLSHLIWQLVQ